MTVRSETLRAFLWSSLLLCAASCGPRSSHRDVVLIMIDTLRADALQSYGCDQDSSPNITALARQGVQFDNVLASSPWTGPSVSSIVTGRYPDELGMVGLLSPLPPAAPLLSELFRKAGYRTGGVVSNGVAGPAYGHDRGYDDYYFKSYKKVIRKGVLKIPHFTADKVTDEALRILEKWDDAGDKAPRFLFVHYTDPHEPYLPPAEIRERFLGGLAPLPDDYLLGKQFVRNPLPADGLRRLRAHYLGEVAFTDRHVGRLLERVPDDALVVVTSDHGEEFLDHGGFLHGHSLYQELLHVPWILRGPGVRQNVRVDRAVSQVDIAPTLLDWAGIETERAFSGESLLPWLTGEPAEETEPRPLFAMLETEKTRLKVIREGSWKLGFYPGEERRVLFDLESDPGETRSVARRNRSLADSLLERVQERDRSLDPLVAEEDPEKRKAREEELRAIGYIK